MVMGQRVRENKKKKKEMGWGMLRSYGGALICYLNSILCGVEEKVPENLNTMQVVGGKRRGVVL